MADAPLSLRDLAPIKAGLFAEVSSNNLRFPAAVDLGGGLVTMPVVESVERTVDESFSVSLKHRRCSNCADPDAKLGTAGPLPGRPLYWEPVNDELPPFCRLETVIDPATGATTTYFVPEKGGCTECGTGFNFLPFEPGTMIDEFRIKGIGHSGGEGVIYFADDVELGVPVVIKTPLDRCNKSSTANGRLERDALVQLRGLQGLLQIRGYRHYEDEFGEQEVLVMDWVDGLTLWDLRDRNRGPLQIEVGLCLMKGLLVALQGAHARNILHVDIKDQNVILTVSGELIICDWGTAFVEGKDGQAIGMSPGVSAPEIVAGKNPTRASEVWAAFRLLCSMSLSFDREKFSEVLPTPSQEALFKDYPSLYRFGRRCMAKDPRDRFTVAEAIQAVDGLIAEIVAQRAKRPVPMISTIFASTFAAELNHRTLPSFLLDRNDAAKDAVKAALAIPDPVRQREVLEGLVTTQPESIEVRLRLAALMINTATTREERASAKELLLALKQDYPFDCRSVYLLGILALAERNIDDARDCFDACYSFWPAEVAVKLANGLVSELKGDYASGSFFYEVAARINPECIAGTLGWARCALQAGHPDIAIEAYDLIPIMSPAYALAVKGKAKVLIDLIEDAKKGSALVGLPELQEVTNSFNYIARDGETFEMLRLKADLLTAVIAGLGKKLFKEDAQVTILGVQLVEKNLRAAAKETLLQCAALPEGTTIKRALEAEAGKIGASGWAAKVGSWKLF
jgi:serine/threonine protein kinase